MTKSSERLRLLVLGAQRDGNRRLSDRLSPASLTPAQAEIVGVLADHDALTLSQLGQRIVCETGSPSRTVDLLVRRGLVDRQQAERDRRSVELRLTAAGREVVPLVRQAMRDIDDGIAGALSAGERTRMDGLLTKLLAGTEALAAIERRDSS